MNKHQLIDLIREKRSFLCVGLDSDIEKLPGCVKGCDDPVFEFNRQIIDATLPYTIAYKPNIAFYESIGIKGLVSLKKTMDYLHEKGSAFLIADAKRGDIGNTSKQYAKAFFDKEGGLEFDAITLAPYMGEDSIGPFLEYKDKWSIILALTSNKGAEDFQYFENSNNIKLFEKVILTSISWADDNQIMFVAGATKVEKFINIRLLAPHSFLLVPGIGAQGGSLEDVCKYGMTSDCELIVNSSRGIIFADKTENFARVAGEKAHQMQEQMDNLLKKYSSI